MTIDVEPVIEHRPLGKLQYLVLAAAASTIVLDGFDIQILAFAAPQILHEWGMTKSAFGPVLAAALIGMALGTLLGGLAADKWGRKPTLIGSTLIFGICSIAAAFSRDPMELALLRFVTGLGLGGAVPTSTALVAEWMPAKFRSLGVSLVLVGVPIGGFIGASLAAWIIPQFGWRACFILGGAVPLILAVAMIALPESPKFLALRANRADRLARLLNSLTGSSNYSASDKFAFSERPEAGNKQEAGLNVLFSTKYRRSTGGLWIAFFANLLATYAFINWIPVLLASHGFPLKTAISGSFYFNLCGIVGALASAYAIARAGSLTVLIFMTVIGLLGVAGTAYQLIDSSALPNSAAAPVIAGMAIAGGALLSIQVALYSVASSAYPTESRATGIGTASFMGRIGAIASAFWAGAILSLPSGEMLYFLLVALMLVLVALATTLIDRHIGKSQSSIDSEGRAVRQGVEIAGDPRNSLTNAADP